MSIRLFLISMALAAAAAPNCRAQVPATQAVKPAAPASAASGVQFVEQRASDTENYIGDKVRYPTAIFAKGIALGSDEVKNVCIEPNIDLRGLGKVNIKMGTQLVEHKAFVVMDPAPTKVTVCKAEEQPAENSIVALDPAMLKSVPPKRSGLTFGTLVVPYKYHLKGDQSLGGGATLGGYLGWRYQAWGYDLQAVGFAGATKVDVPGLKDGKATTDSVAGLSYGIGLLGTVKNEFKLGLVAGQDRVNRSVNYVNNGKTWFSVSIGYDFFN